MKLSGSDGRSGMGHLGAIAVFVFLQLNAAFAMAQQDNTPVFTPAEEVGSTIAARAGAETVMDLTACVSEALLANDALQAERLRMAELQGQMKQALSTGLPTVDLVGDWSRSRSPVMALDSTFGGSGGGFAPPPGSPLWFEDWLGGFGSLIPAAEDIEAQTFMHANLNFSWNINPMKVSGAMGAARLGIDRQKLNETNFEQKTTEQTMVAYYNIVKAAEKIHAVKAQLSNQNELLNIMRLRYELGMATRLDTLQAAVTLANIQPRLNIAEADLRNQGSRLNALMGRRPEQPLSVVNSQSLERDRINDDTALLLAQQRPDLASVDVFTDILRRNRKAQKAENMPFITVNGAYGYVGTQFDNIFENGHDSWSAAVALNIPVFDGMLHRGLVAETEAQIRRTEAEQSGHRRLVQVEVLEVLANLRLARGVLDAVELNLTRSEEVLEESLLMLEMGKINYLDVLVSESNRAEARSNVIDARYEVLALTASLKRAVGYSPLVSLQSIPGMVTEVSK
ncbi:MAG: TolC family protein [bacterium]|nr:TolC family protein [bacterium]